jgi:hypothetical protein
MTQAQIQVPTPGLVRVVGRVEQSRQTAKAGTYRTLVTLPAPDAFKHPSTVEVRSKARLGAQGHEVDVLCNLLGFKTKPKLNPETGELWPVGAQIVLEAIAA